MILPNPLLLHDLIAQVEKESGRTVSHMLTFDIPYVDKVTGELQHKNGYLSFMVSDTEELGYWYDFYGQHAFTLDEPRTWPNQRIQLHRRIEI